ncbi:MAG: PEGA domain-containing protein [Paludibacter sp.]|nr:PEGA domain-containing protein [Paludibacter sp.]
MKKNLIVLISMIFSLNIGAQSAYIEVRGEPGLSVFLNNSFKGITSTEHNGYIIGNVTPGNNLIKIVKEGFTPYEETINVKPGEVLAYKVKPFVKHTVYVSEQGNSAQTEKKAIIESGKLIVQSVPIEIKISIPAIEGVENKLKTKDEMIFDKMPAGNYKIIFNFNQKIVEKTITIKKDDEIGIFINMINGEFKITNLGEERRYKEKVENEKVEKDRIERERILRENEEIARKYKERVQWEKAERERKEEINDWLTYLIGIPVVLTLIFLITPLL